MNQGADHVQSFHNAVTPFGFSLDDDYGDLKPGEHCWTKEGDHQIYVDKDGNWDHTDASKDNYSSVAKGNGHRSLMNHIANYYKF